MSQQVEHAKRKQTILQKAMDVFYAKGYANTTYQKIADRCGISRPILYLYFPNKKTIFRGGIMLILQDIETRFKKVTADPGLKTSEKLLRISTILVDRFMQERNLFTVLLEYFGILRARGATPHAKVIHMTAGARKVYIDLIREGIENGEILDCDPSQIYRAVFSLLEAAALRLAILGEENVDDIKGAIALIVRAIERPPAAAGA